MATAKSTPGASRERSSRPAVSASRAPLSASADVSREDRDGTFTTPSERQRMIRSEFQQEALPNAPVIPGYHACWLATNSSYDPIHKRMRMGYTPVRPDEVPGLETFRMKSADLGEMVTCNEMALFKIPTDLYLEIMQEFHHNLPMSDEESLRAQLRGNGQADAKGRPLLDEDKDIEGFDDLAVRRTPQFAL